jgi:uncharacterized protein YbbC (DUF1343 family)
MRLGIDRLLHEDQWRPLLRDQRLGVLCHAASLTSQAMHTLDALAAAEGLELAAAFGPQHGVGADKQDNMIETADARHPRYGIPIFSLYGEMRRPSQQMLGSFDVLLIDLQDIGTRIYTYVTTMRYMLEACAEHGKSVVVLDRPNPIGRPVEGALLRPGWESFVGPGALPMRHGMTLGELAGWFRHELSLQLDLTVVPMQGWEPQSGPGYGWPLAHLPWVNPSPNASSLNMARCYPGTVLLEGTELSEGRGTSTPLELIGAPGLNVEALLQFAQHAAPEWLEGCHLRPCTFEPTFHKHVGTACEGLQIHTDHAAYRHDRFRPYRLIAILLKGVREQWPEAQLWRDFEYEYETDRQAIDLINGGAYLREWVDASGNSAGDLDRRLAADEAEWRRTRAPFLLY